MTAKEYLEQLIIMDERIKRKCMRLDTLRSVAMNTSSTFAGEAVQRSRQRSPLENIMVKVVDLSREIDADVDALVDFKAEVWTQLDKMSDERYKKILWLKYAERKKWDEISDCIPFTARYIRKLHIQALDEFENVFEKRPPMTTQDHERPS